MCVHGTESGFTLHFCPAVAAGFFAAAAGSALGVAGGTSALGAFVTVLGAALAGAGSCMPGPVAHPLSTRTVVAVANAKI